MTEIEQAMELVNERCLQHTKYIDSLAADLKKAVFGNGTEGLGTRVTKVEMRVQNAEGAIRGIEEDRSKIRWTLYSILASLALMLIGALGSQYMMYAKAEAVAAASKETAMQSYEILQELKADLAKGAN